MNRFLFLYICFVISTLSFVGAGRVGGLAFPGNECRFSERSSLRLFTNGYEPGAVDSISVEFLYSPRNLKSPGYIIMIKNGSGSNDYNFTYNVKNDEGIISFSRDGKQMLATAHFQLDRFPARVPVKLKLFVSADSACVIVGDNTVQLSDIGLAGQDFTPHFVFGMCDHILETASFSICGLKVGLDGKVFEFPLDESAGNDVHTLDGRIMGQVDNPLWLINRSYYWDHIYESTFSTPAGCVFTDGREDFIIYTRDSVTTFDLRANASVITPYVSDNDWFVRLGMGFYNPEHNSIYAYELNSDHTIVGEIFPDMRQCEILDRGGANLQMHHHGSVYLPDEGKILMFGGYGNRRYYNDLIEFDLNRSRWDTLHLSGDVITPRFFVAMGLSPDGRNLYIYGGKGNSSGDQDVGVVYYYDMYRIDLETLVVSKLWEQEEPEIKRVPTRHIIVSPDGESMYVMAYPEYHPHSVLRLYRMSIDDGKCEELADSIPIVSEEIATNSALYYCKSLDRLYCVVQEYSVVTEPGDGCENTVNIYSLNAPPVALDAVKRYEAGGKPSGCVRYIIAAVFIIVLVALFVWRRSRICRTEVSAVGSLPSGQPGPAEYPAPAESVGNDNDEILSDDDVDIDMDGITKVYRNSLFLFGPFTAYDRTGRDITYLYSPKIRQIFVYLLLNSMHKEGVMSSDLSALFWVDKAEDKIKNLKNVTMSKLRKVLQEFDGIELIYRKGYFRIEMTDGFNCDYVSLYRLTDGLLSGGGVSDGPDTTACISDILARGKFLVGFEQAIFDYYRQQVEQFSVGMLSDRIVQCFDRGENSSTLLACNILSSVDPLSEFAMRYAVRVNMRRNHKEKALMIYRLFVKEYARIFGEKYQLTFSQVAGE